MPISTLSYTGFIVVTHTSPYKLVPWDDLRAIELCVMPCTVFSQLFAGVAIVSVGGYDP